MLSKLPIAVQVYSVRDDAAADFKGTLQKLKDMGYDGVELAGLYGMTAAEVRAALDEVGIPAISAHVPYAELELMLRAPSLLTKRSVFSTSPSLTWARKIVPALLLLRRL